MTYQPKPTHLYQKPEKKAEERKKHDGRKRTQNIREHSEYGCCARSGGAHLVYTYAVPASDILLIGVIRCDLGVKRNFC